MELQRLWAECLYLKELSQKSRHLALSSDGSQIHSSGGVQTTLQYQKNKLQGLDRHGNWARLVRPLKGERMYRENTSATKFEFTFSKTHMFIYVW